MLSFEYKTNTEYCFDAFCKKAMRFEACNCHKIIRRRRSPEVSLNYLMDECGFEPSSLNGRFNEWFVQNISTKLYING